MKFNFLNQCTTMDILLQACLNALPHLPEQSQAELEKALRTFEQSAVPTVWSTDDVGDSHGLTTNEKRAVIDEFIENYECKEIDWMVIDGVAQMTREMRTPHIRVEFDTDGDLLKSGKYAFIPVSYVDAIAKEHPTEDAIKIAFARYTGISAIRIVHYKADELYNEYGEMIEHWDASSLHDSTFVKKDLLCVPEIVL